MQELLMHVKARKKAIHLLAAQKHAAFTFFMINSNSNPPGGLELEFITPQHK
jgi:hypothetical protein